MTVAVNWLAVLLSAVLSVVIGFMWYGPLFGKAWMKEVGIKMPEDGKAPNMTLPMVISIIGGFFLAYGLTHSLAFGNAYLNMSGASSGLMGGFWSWLTFVVPVYLNTFAWEKRSWKLFFIGAGYWLVLILAMGLILVSWK